MHWSAWLPQWRWARPTPRERHWLRKVAVCKRCAACTCSPRTDGNIVGGVAVPKAIVEGIDFNGDGTLVSPFATVSINGTIIHSSGSVGSYTVAADCTGTLAFTGGATFDIFVEPTGKQLWMIQTGPMPAVFEGTVTRVWPALPGAD